MALSEMLMSGLELMVLGMGMVFMFLAVLIVVMRGMSVLAARLEGEVEPPEAKPLAVSAGAASDLRLIAAISAAVTRYRSTRGA
ncbi:OadG family protein [endosymbiont of unidentified scaly snail isolate Monju]|uniref:OadG family protein n=1 Tax=endosymbiont of unidentified scaly snail isolate Monju TaxID=1248727 RepID=UPI0003891A77|nr:OadG family protein [endosymbiont of unidentified scaly snail isolate Monju]BAN69115.1 oxaloacetate decarboxylase, gamma subunit [endosymbiont of unidentified scaly snail isolate Monju]